MPPFILIMDKLAQKIKLYSEIGFYNAVNDACRKAQIDTRAFIARTHPHSGFGGKVFADTEFVLGKYNIQSKKIDATIYANYFARWWNTGFFHPVIRTKPPKVRHKKVPPHGNYFENNKAAIVDYYNSRIDYYMQEGLKKWQTQK